MQGPHHRKSEPLITTPGLYEQVPPPNMPGGPISPTATSEYEYDDSPAMQQLVAAANADRRSSPASPVRPELQAPMPPRRPSIDAGMLMGCVRTRRCSPSGSSPKGPRRHGGMPPAPPRRPSNEGELEATGFDEPPRVPRRSSIDGGLGATGFEAAGPPPPRRPSGEGGLLSQGAAKSRPLPSPPGDPPGELENAELVPAKGRRAPSAEEKAALLKTAQREREALAAAKREAARAAQEKVEARKAAAAKLRERAMQEETARKAAVAAEQQLKQQARKQAAAQLRDRALAEERQRKQQQQQAEMGRPRAPSAEERDALLKHAQQAVQPALARAPTSDQRAALLASAQAANAPRARAPTSDQRAALLEQAKAARGERRQPAAGGAPGMLRPRGPRPTDSVRLALAMGGRRSQPPKPSEAEDSYDRDESRTMERTSSLRNSKKLSRSCDSLTNMPAEEFYDNFSALQQREPELLGGLGAPEQHGAPEPHGAAGKKKGGISRDRQGSRYDGFGDGGHSSSDELSDFDPDEGGYGFEGEGAAKKKGGGISKSRAGSRYDGFDEGGSKSKGPQRQPSVYKGFQDSAAAPVDPNVDPFAAYGEEDLSSNSDIEF